LGWEGQGREGKAREGKGRGRKEKWKGTDVEKQGVGRTARVRREGTGKDVKVG